MYILVENDVIIAKSNAYEQRENGILIGGAIYPMGELVEVDVPINVIPQKYCYTETEGFYINPMWEQSVDNEIQKAIDDYTLLLMEMGLL